MTRFQPTVFGCLVCRQMILAGRHQFWKVAEAELGEKAHPKWNFHKVLVGRDGRILQAYPSGVRPNDVGLVADIEAALG